MKVEKIQNSIYGVPFEFAENSNQEATNIKCMSNNKIDINSKDILSFKAKDISLSKRGWFIFGQTSEYMKQPSEMISAIIQAIGTSIVAPIAILASPNKGHVHNKEEEEAAKEKRVFQAFRQPFSALIALAFQVPATLAIAKTFDHFAYEKPIKFFRDETINDLIPDKGYLAKQAKKALKEKADPKVVDEWKSELEYAHNINQVKEDLKKEIKKKYSEYNIELSDEKLEKMASEKKRVNKFVANKMASLKHDKLLDAKINELKNKTFDIKDIDLVTGEDKDLAREKFKDKFKALKNEKLNWLDKCIKTMGFANGRIKKYNDAEDALAKEKGLELLKAEKPEIFSNPAERFKQFIKNRDEHATKIYKNKKFWIQLVTNLAMVAISCTVLNWMHPKFMDFWEGVQQAKREEKQKKASQQKVEVSA